MKFADRFARLVGPFTSRHKLVLRNLALASPEKHESDQLFDYDPKHDQPGRIEVSGIAKFTELRDRKRPFIVFNAHTGTFELLSVVGATFVLDVTSLFRPPNNPYVATRLSAFRRKRIGSLVPSNAGSAFALARQLERGGGVGILVDQKFRKGVRTKFFGEGVQTNPLLAKLVRRFGCDVFPARCIRLPNNRFRLDLEPKLEIPRNRQGAVDIEQTAQLLNEKVET